MRNATLSLTIALALCACGRIGPPDDADRVETAVDQPAPATAAPAPGGTADAIATQDPLDAALAGDWRGDTRARDQYRHPAETLRFFGVEPDDTVVEITPGGGWYARVLAPYLRANGHYVAAVVDPERAGERARDYQARARDQLQGLLADTSVYGETEIVAFDPAAPAFGAPGSADVVLTFRNVHNWRGGGNAEAMFRGFFEVLKPGGVLGVVEHRAAQDVPDDDGTGYVGEAQVVALAEQAGFRLDGKSEINANPADTRDHPNGVWTLPPTSNLPEGADPAPFQAIGESDRMTLRFVKPQA
ncbi:class I SAM-dependent methyltransferase [Coralloluteibacterium stylophorae]|uniref:Class I SAM-dependent methyltransferase n=1 Tax=Coralloluteibacterium stylophorae TaxID=1776034 RepID=A0A8J8AW63_9GAMM|nr:class I SAM-dependent methyltransferase [Coralloluteibacterium stylophorae]MBS7458146.1 class I SAM-dependent methyltransferase [Coralloluteibacterium stylophorae]